MGINAGAIMARIRNMFSGFTTGQKTMTAIALVVALGAAGFFATWVSKPTYAPLFTGLSGTDASAITAKLTESKEPYQLADGGQTVLVPQADVYQQRITLSGLGLPAGGGGGDGYSLLDKQSMTSSDFQQKVTYQRALEGELRKTIEAIDGVKAAVVHLAIPSEDVFTENASKPTASVLVKTDPTTPLKSAQVEAIVHLVSSSVPKLGAEQVTVADSAGRVLNAAGDTGAASAMSDARAQQTQGFEKNTEGTVQAMLDKLVGPGHAVTRVAANLNFDQQTTDKQEYINDKKVPALTDSTTKETYQGAGSPVGGVLGPDNNAVPSGTATGANSKYVKEQQTRANAVGTLKTTTAIAAGQPRRVTVAVLLDQLVAGRINDADLSKLVSTAAGLDAKRGDLVTVTKMAFDTTGATQAKKELEAATAEKSQADLINLGKTGGLILLILLVLVLAVRKGRKVERTTVDLGELSVYREQNLALEASVRSMAAQAEVRNSLEPAEITTSSRLESQAVSRREIGQLIEQQPDEVARLLRGWLVERRP
ncbi:MAG: flagellar M-ring protein FliF [Actinomycetota bacterium]|jgi:flagellar M-ring protein FliF|nr:flagellar M-ring protein FliF [Actinomycetota bacterium]